MKNIHNRNCFANHMGLYMIELGYFLQTYKAIQSGLLPVRSLEELEEIEASLAFLDDHFPLHADYLSNRMDKLMARVEDDSDDGIDRPYKVSRGVAIMPVEGTMMKGSSKYGGTSTVRLRQSLRMAANDKKVKSMLLAIDSPGGHVAGNKDLVDDIRNIDRNVKPIHSHIDDMGASAAYWAASATRSISVNETGMVGSIGTFGVVYDQSKQYEQEGVKVHVLSTGKYKGAFVPGAEITKEQLGDMQRNIDTLNGFFLGDVAEGRGMKQKQVESVADGRVHIGQEAADLGLVDHVRSFSDTLNDIADTKTNNSGRRSRNAVAQFKLNQTKD